MTRGDIYRVRLPKRGGREQHGSRYAVVVQADELLSSSTLVIAPTSQSARAASFRPEIEVAGERTRVMVEQLRALSVERFGDLVGRLSVDELADVDEALRLVLGL